MHDLEYVPSAGATSGLLWWGEFVPDQRETDSYSLVYDTEPLGEEIEILGLPHAILHVSATAPLANWFVRLSDVAPDGSVTLITGAALSGAQRESASNPKELEPGKVYELDIELHFTSWVFQKGHRIRVAISNAVWPMVWPTPYSMTTSLYLGGETPSRLLLPVLPCEKRPRPHFRAPEYIEVPGLELERKTERRPEWMVHRHPHGGTTSVVYHILGTLSLPFGRRVFSETYTYKIDDAHPEAASLLAEEFEIWELEDRVLTFKAILDLSGDKENMYYNLKRELYKEGKLIREKTFKEAIRRDHQ